MNEDFFEDISAIAPIDFFSLECDLQFSLKRPSSKIMQQKYLLPNTSELMGEEHFAEVAMAWNEEGIFVDVNFKQPFEDASFPHFSEADAVELFFDTRDLKTAGFATKYCHHFLFLPQPVHGIQSQELTVFRSEDAHPLCDSTELQVDSTFGKSFYSMYVFIPKHCLFGFDPATYDRLGFTYRLHRKGDTPQHFSLSSEHFKIEQHPKLWASLSLCRT